MFRQQLSIEAAHQFSRRPIVHCPKTCHHTSRAGVQKATAEAYDAFAQDLVAERRLTGAQNHKIRMQVQVVDFVKPQEAVLRLPLFIHKREHDSRKVGCFTIEQSVRGEVHDSITTESGACG